MIVDEAAGSHEPTAVASHGARVETYRGAVGPMDCDVSEHMNISAYFERLSVAECVLRSDLFDDPFDPRVSATATGVRFLSEMVSGDVLHIESGLVHVGEYELRAQHLVKESVTGRVASIVETAYRRNDVDGHASAFTSAEHARLADLRVSTHESSQLQSFDDPDEGGLRTTVVDVPDVSAIGPSGRIEPGYIIARFSDGTLQTLSSLGLSGDLRDSERISFAAFELQLSYGSDLAPRGPVIVESAVRQMKNTSMRLYHRLSSRSTGRVIAEMSQLGVCLDLETRRPTTIPKFVREAAGF